MSIEQKFNDAVQFLNWASFERNAKQSGKRIDWMNVSFLLVKKQEEEGKKPVSSILNWIDIF